MKTSIQLIFASLTFLFFLASCNKNNNESPLATICQLTKAVYYVNNAKSDSGFYVYANNKISRINWVHWYYTFEYSGDNITKRSVFETGGTTAYMYDQIAYNADNTISKIEKFGFAPGGGSLIRTDVIEFTYSNGKVSKSSFKRDNNGTLALEEDYVYSYTGNNITKCVNTLYTNDVPVSTFEYNYTYDNNINYYVQQNRQALLLEELDGAWAPIILSSNNMISNDVFGSPVTFTLQLNSSGYLQNTLSMNSNMLASYTYNCQ